MLEAAPVPEYAPLAGPREPSMHIALAILALLAQDPAELVKRLGDDDWAVREAATQALADLGEGVFPELEPAIRSADPEVAARAQWIRTLVLEVEPYGAAIDEQILLGIQRLLQHDAPDIVLWPGGRTLPPGVSACFLKTLDECRDDGARCLDCLAWMKNYPWRGEEAERLVRILDPILARVEAPADEVAAEGACHILESLLRLEPLPWTDVQQGRMERAWGALAHANSSRIREQVSAALGCGRTPCAERILRDLADDVEPAVAEAACLALEGQGQDASGAWKSLFLRPAATSRRGCTAYRSAKCGDRECLRYLFDCLDNPSFGVQRDTVFSLLCLTGERMPIIDTSAGYHGEDVIAERRAWLQSWWSANRDRCRWDAERRVWTVDDLPADGKDSR